MAMTKANIVEEVYKKVGFSKSQAAEIVETVFETMKQVLERGEKLKISGFGNFTPRDKKTRIGRNPKTGKAIKVPAKILPFFKVGKELKKRVDS